MYPVLFEIPLFGGITIHSYGVMVALGFVAGIIWATHDGKKNGIEPSKILDFVFYLLLASMLGSRLFYIVISGREEFFQNPLTAFQIWRGGLVFYGGLICALVVAVWYIRKYKLPPLVTFDVFAPAIAIGHAVGRIGCLLAGCCYGSAVSGHHWYAITFPNNPNCFAPTGIPLYPTQLMETGGELLIFGILMLIRHFRRFKGQLIASYLMLYAILRFSTEMFRGDAERGYLIEPWISTSQFVSAIMFLAGFYMYVKLRGRKDAWCARVK